jgi:glycosyltransferase involved in cell wall biosynthesis
VFRLTPRRWSPSPVRTAWLTLVRQAKPFGRLVPRGLRRRLHRMTASNIARSPTVRTDTEGWRQPDGSSVAPRSIVPRDLVRQPPLAAASRLPSVLAVLAVSQPDDALANAVRALRRQSYADLKIVVLAETLDVPASALTQEIDVLRAAGGSGSEGEVLGDLIGGNHDVTVLVPPGAGYTVSDTTIEELVGDLFQCGISGNSSFYLGYRDSDEGTAGWLPERDQTDLLRCPVSRLFSLQGSPVRATLRTVPRPSVRLDPPLVGPDAPEPRRLGVGVRPVVVGIPAAGRADPQALSALIEASTGCQFVLVGDGEKDGAAAIAARHSPDRVQVVGASDAQDALAGTDALLVPPGIGARDAADSAATLAVSYALGRWTFVPNDVPTLIAPYQLTYRPESGLPDLDLVRTARPAPAETARLLAGWRGARSDEAVVARARERPSTSASQPRLRCLLATHILDTGGVEEVVAQLARGLPTVGVETTVLCSRGGRVARRLSADGIDVRELGLMNLPLDKVFQDLDVDVVSGHNSPSGLVEVAQRQGLRLLETLHNTPVWVRDREWPRVRERLTKADGLIAVSDVVRQHYRAHGIGVETPTWTIPNAVDRSRLQLAHRGAARDQLGVDGQFLFVSLARYEPQKNTYGLLLAFERVHRQRPNTRLLIAGRVDDPIYHAHVAELRDSLGSRYAVRLLDHSSPARLLAAADAFVLDSFFEGWPLASMEALYSGVPLILSDVGGAVEQVGPDDDRGLLVPNPAGTTSVDLHDIRRLTYARKQPNQEALVDAMGTMVKNWSQWEDRRTSLSAQATRLFDEEHFLESYAEVLAKSGK